MSNKVTYAQHREFKHLELKTIIDLLRKNKFTSTATIEKFLTKEKIGVLDFSYYLLGKFSYLSAGTNRNHIKLALDEIHNELYELKAIIGAAVCNGEIDENE